MQIDRLERDAFIAEMKNIAPYTSNEREFLMKSLEHANYKLIGGRVTKVEDVNGMDPAKRIQHEAKQGKWKRIQSGGNTNDLVVKRFTKYKKGDPFVWGKAKATIHASSKNVLAWIWHYCSNHRYDEHACRASEAFEHPQGQPHGIFEHPEEQRSRGANDERSDECCYASSLLLLVGRSATNEE